MPSRVSSANNLLGLQPEQPIRDIVAILILGLSNTGKSTFINRLLDNLANESTGERQHARVRDGMSAMTDNVEQFTLVREPGRRAILVDTPGLDHTELSDSEVLERIGVWLEASFKSGIRIGAILYFHDMSSDLVTATMRRDVNILKQLCGPDSLGAVTICTTKWDMVPPMEDALAREEELRSRLWSDLIRGGCGVHRAGTQEEALSLLEAVLHKIDKPLLLTMQQELVRGLALPKTGAGRALRGLPPKKSTTSIRQHSRYSKPKRFKPQGPGSEEGKVGQGWTPVDVNQCSPDLPLDRELGSGSPEVIGSEVVPGSPKDNGKVWSGKRVRNMVPSRGWDVKTLFDNLIKRLHNIRSDPDSPGKDERAKQGSRLIEAPLPSSVEGLNDLTSEEVGRSARDRASMQYTSSGSYGNPAGTRDDYYHKQRYWPFNASVPGVQGDEGQTPGRASWYELPEY